MNVLNLPPSFGQKLGASVAEALGSTIEDRIAMSKHAKERRSAMEALNKIPEDASYEQRISSLIDSGVPINTAMQLLEQQGKYQERVGKAAKATDIGVEDKKAALDRIQRMRQLRETGKLGFGSGVLASIFRGESARIKGEYEQLGKSLIQYATTIPIRNKAEFEEFAKKLSDATISDAEAEGILKAMEDIIRGSERELGAQPAAIKERPPLSAFMR